MQNSRNMRNVDGVRRHASLRMPQVGAWLGALLCALTLVCGPAFSLATPAYAADANAPAKQAKPDRVLIDALEKFGPLQMAPAKFPHNKHAEEVFKRGENCGVCHLDMKANFDFKGLPGKFSAKAAEDKFHTNCITCHVKWDDGPRTAECAQCHEAATPNKATPVNFDKSLHAIHIASKDIGASEGASAGSPNCGACHHVLDPLTKKLVWESGKEDACAACHAAEQVGDVLSLKDASHRSCVTCHVEQAAKLAATAKADGKDTGKSSKKDIEKKDKDKEDKDKKEKDKKGKDKKHKGTEADQALFKGPVTCENCHGPEKQAEFPKLKDVPRLMRGQPDSTLLLPLNNAGETKSGAGTGVNPVVFNHKAHEAATESCRVCHHVRIADKGCTSCHTVEGRAEGKNVTLFTAMHKADATASCVGCHQQTIFQNKDCAGCHVLMTPAVSAGKAESACGVCHAPVPGFTPADLVPAEKTVGAKNTAALEQIAEEALSKRTPVAPLTVADVPETVTIGILSNEYEPSVFPHRKIYQSLVAGMGTNALAGAFHKTPESVCAACHHNVPVADLRQPPKCVTCHSATVGVAALGTPMPLKQALHQQCMACHEVMQVKPVATDCTGCHALRPQAPAKKK